MSTHSRPDVTQRFSRRATLRRSLSLLSSFRYERTEPARFYSGLADDTADLIGDLYADLAGSSLRDAVVVDVGGGAGYFADAFAAVGADYLPVEPDPSEMHAADLHIAGSVRGSGLQLPIRSDAVDVCMSSNVAEHVADPWTMASEMLRITRPGGLMMFSYTLWWGPFGGHETGPWHYLGGEYAARRFVRKHGREPKNRFGRSLFALGCAEGLRWARTTDEGELLAAFPRYHPRWAWWLVRVPVLRELLVSNLVLVMRAP